MKFDELVTSLIESYDETVIHVVISGDQKIGSLLLGLAGG